MEPSGEIGGLTCLGIAGVGSLLQKRGTPSTASRASGVSLPFQAKKMARVELEEPYIGQEQSLEALSRPDSRFFGRSHPRRNRTEKTGPPCARDAQGGRMQQDGGGGGNRTHVRRTRRGSFYVRSLRSRILADCVVDEDDQHSQPASLEIQTRCEAPRALRSTTATPATDAVNQRFCRDVTAYAASARLSLAVVLFRFYEAKLDTQPPSRSVPRRSQGAPGVWQRTPLRT
jgi:hypothetical protein